MRPSPPERLDELANSVLCRLAQAADDREAPWRTPMLATVAADGKPSVRTVVLRSVDPARRLLAIHTDRRSAKAVHVATTPGVELAFWDPMAREQLRVAGQARLLVEGPQVDRAWATAPGEVRAIYIGPCAPGTPLPGPERTGISATAAGWSGDRTAFAILEIVWTRWDWLWLSADGHRRAMFAFAPDGTVRSDWVEP